MTAIAILLWPFLSLGTASPQFAVMPYPGFMHVVPGVYGIAVPQQKISERTTTTTTTTTAKPPEAEEESFKIYVAVPYAFQNFSFRLPPQLPYKMTPPLMPMPLPMPLPPPLMMVPIPPVVEVKFDGSHEQHECDSSESCTSSSSSESDTESSSENSESKSRRKRKKKKKSYGIYRSNRRVMKPDSNEEVKPVLTYRTKDGDLKLKKRLTMKEAASLVKNARKSGKKVHVMVGNDTAGKPRVMIVADGAKKSKSQRRTQTNSEKSSQFKIGNGHKELMFKVPNNKTISNLTVSFNINR